MKDHISKLKKQNGEDYSNGAKNVVIEVYDKFCHTNQIPFDKIRYDYQPPIPLIPTTENVKKIISATTEKYTTIFTILAETGLEAKELERLSRKQIDTEQGIISVVGCKHHANGTYKLKTTTANMLRRYLAKNTEEHPFPTSKVMGTVWRNTRDRVAKNLCQPELKKIPMKNLRNYSGAQLYHKLPDPIAVMRHLRHKKLDTTMHYLRGITTGEEQEFICKTAQTLKEATELIEAGFTYVTEIEETKLFRKLK